MSKEGGTSRPQLKGRHIAHAKKHLLIGIAFAVTTVLITKVAVNDRRKAAYAEFYRYHSIQFNKKLPDFWQYKTIINLSIAFSSLLFEMFGTHVCKFSGTMTSTHIFIRSEMEIISNHADPIKMATEMAVAVTQDEDYHPNEFISLSFVKPFFFTYAICVVNLACSNFIR